MAILGLILIILGWVFAIPVLVYIGVALLVIGLILWVAPQGFQSGRRWY